MEIKNKMKNYKRWLAVAGFVVAPILLGASACPSADVPDDPKKIADNRQNYIPKNDVEGHNYNAKLILADNPSTLIWCSYYPSNPNVPAGTVPIVGKLTSSNKRPKPGTIVYYGDSGSYNPELPGDDGMYGTSSEYRFGFDPAGNYHDFTNLEMHCTNVPDVIQKATTKLDISISDGSNLAAIDSAVQAELKKCHANDKKNPNGSVNYDPTKSCPAAAALLGLVHSDN